MQLANIKVYKESECKSSEGLYNNYEGLNMLSTVFSVMFTILNSILLSYLMKTVRDKLIMLFSVYILQFAILIGTTFDFAQTSYLTIAALAISTTFVLIFVPSFHFVSNSIIDELQQEQEYFAKRENQYKKMFDSL